MDKALWKRLTVVVILRWTRSILLTQNRINQIGTMGSHISDKEILKIKQQFLALDVDGGCNITPVLLRSLLDNPKSIMSENDANDLIKELGLDRNGGMDSCEFLIQLSNRKDTDLKEALHRAITLRSPIRKEFKNLDTNEDGHITPKEFRNIMKKHKGMLSDKQLETMVKEAKKNDAGKIDYDEFAFGITNRVLMHNMYGIF